jgi:glucan phosphoethanolaminetransferase (alkaline phosphatase superfamily)
MLPICVRNTLLVFGLSLVSTSLLLIDDFLFQHYFDSGYAALEPIYALVIFLLSICLWLCRNRWLVISILLIFSSMQLIQFSHMAFSGEPLSVSDLRNLQDNMNDVAIGARHTWKAYMAVLWVVGLPYGLLLLLYTQVPTRLTIPSLPFIWLLILAIILAKPIRATYRGLDDFLPGPTRSALHNSMNVFAFFIVSTIRGDQIVSKVPRFRPYEMHQQAPGSTQHIWLVIADSIRHDRMSIYGASRETTPNLQRWMSSMQAVRLNGIAAGVSTAVSLPALINVIREPGQEQWMRDRQHNLFRIAKDNGFKTFWFSSQESKLLSYLGRPFIDHVVSREDRALGFMRKRDGLLPELLEEQISASKSFAVINMRSVHFPYETNYSHDHSFTPPWSMDDAQSHEERMNNAYDNALRHWDGVMDRVLQAFSRLDGEKYLIVTSDHGQLLGEDGRWGHNRLHPQVIEVPMLVFADHLTLPKHMLQEKWVSHYELGLWIAERLGVKIENPNHTDNLHFNHGDQLLGDRWVMPISEISDRLEYHEPVMLSDLLTQQKIALQPADAMESKSP